MQFEERVELYQRRSN